MRPRMSESTLEARVAALIERGFGASATLGGLRPLAGDASSRRYFRAEVRGGAAPTAVVMETSGSGLAISSDELAVFDADTGRELPFLNVQRYLCDAGVPVPEVLAADEPHGLILLEDLGDVTLWDGASAATPDARATLFRDAIDELVHIQVVGAGHPDASCLAFRQRFDARLFAWEFDHFLEYGFTGREHDEPRERELRERFIELSEELAQDDMVLTHRDFHSWNLFVTKERIRIIDFQDALLAPLPYDLATLLNDRATPTIIDDRLERALIAHFLHRRHEAFGHAPDAEAFRERYLLFVLQKAAKVVGRFVYLEDVKGKSGYRAMIPGTLATMKRALAQMPRLAGLRRTLARSFPELA